MDSVFTVSDVAKVLRMLEGRRYALTPRGIRYYARTGMVVPSGRLPQQKKARATRLYTLADVALLRLVCQLHRQGVHERALWGVLVYRGEGLRARLGQGRGELVVDSPAALAIGSEDGNRPNAIRVDVRSLLTGLTERLTAYRLRHPRIWTGLSWMDAAEAAKQVAV